MLLLDMISIHAPRTGSDTMCFTPPRRAGHFNPRSPHGERRLGENLTADSVTFQSTLPARGATDPEQSSQVYSKFQSTLPARGATKRHLFPSCREPISIHAPRTGSDTRRSRPQSRARLFQSTLPARGATSWMR